jgi:hypothetical protein
MVVRFIVLGRVVEPSLKKRPQCMALEIQVMTWDGHKNVSGLNTVQDKEVKHFLIFPVTTCQRVNV